MAIITISQQVGSSENKIATQLAERLNYTLIDKKGIRKLASEYACDAGCGIPSIINENKPNFINEFTINYTFYNHLICAVIFDAVSQDNVVIKGRGANFLLFGQPNVFCVRIIAPLAQRVATVQEALSNGEKAETIVNKEDLAQKKFIRFFHNQEISNPNYYDMILNTDKIGDNEVLEILFNRIKTLTQRNFTQKEEHQRLKNLSIERQIKAMIMKKKYDFSSWGDLNVGVHVDGNVTLSGIVNNDLQKTKIENCIKLVSIDKVVKNEMVVISPTY